MRIEFRAVIAPQTEGDLYSTNTRYSNTSVPLMIRRLQSLPGPSSGSGESYFNAHLDAVSYASGCEVSHGSWSSLGVPPEP